MRLGNNAVCVKMTLSLIIDGFIVSLNLTFDLVLFAHLTFELMNNIELLPILLACSYGGGGH